MRTNVEKDYYDWLLHLIGVDDDKWEYELLVRDMHFTSFMPIVQDDRNRAYDGIQLREFFYDEFDPDDILPNEGCSVLEMLVAMCMREQREVLDDGVTNWIKILFWIMVENLGLSDMTIDNFDSNYVYTTLNRWMMRMYPSNGDGNIFIRPDGRRRNYRKAPFWEQMSWYVSDNLI